MINEETKKIMNDLGLVHKDDPAFISSPQHWNETIKGLRKIGTPQALKMATKLEKKYNL